MASILRDENNWDNQIACLHGIATSNELQLSHQSRQAATLITTPAPEITSSSIPESVFPQPHLMDYEDIMEDDMELDQVDNDDIHFDFSFLFSTQYCLK